MRKVLYLALIFNCMMILHGAEKVLTAGLGDHLSYPKRTLEDVEKYYASLHGKGLDLIWYGPNSWAYGSCENTDFIRYMNEYAKIVNKYGMKNLLIVPLESLLPAKNVNPDWLAMKLDPQTGMRVVAKRCWDYASPVAFSEMKSRLEKFITAVKPREAYIVDEVILISPGEDAHCKKMSSYWTSPTYSDAALADFQRFVKKHHLLNRPDAVKFPVTTQKMEPSQKYNMGLPAVPITPENSAYLAEDNDYPDSPLWRAWLAWRTELLTQIYAMQFELAEKILSDNPEWIGCIASNPTFWFCQEAGLDKFRIAAIPQIKYLVAGYTTGNGLLQLKDAVIKNKKLLGGMIETNRYGNPEPCDSKTTIESFKKQVESGARFMLLYPISNFNPELTEANLMKNGQGYQPETINTWAECVKFLRDTGRAAK